MTAAMTQIPVPTTTPMTQIPVPTTIGAFVHFYVDKTSGTTRMVEKVPSLNVEEESGTIELFDYLEKEN